MKRVLLTILGIFFVLILIIVVVFLYNSRDRNPGYELDLDLPTETTTATTQLKVGLAKLRITPNVEDTWVDVDSNAKYEPKKGDSFIDKNANGKFDAYWLAGFSNKRPAMGVHDDLWARTIVWDNGNLKIALVVLDAIGLFHDDVITIREKVIEKKWGIDHVIVATTHNHETPDLMGLWGGKLFKSGVNEKYLEYVQNQAVKAVGQALESARPAIIKLMKIDSTASDLVRDSRPPFILDDAIHLMQFCDRNTGKPFGLLLNWGNHPETLASKNLYVTSDFCYYWLEGIEKGIFYNGEMKKTGVGGIAVFANGAIGGLMTSLGCNIYDPWVDMHFKKASFEKAKAQGYRLANLVLDQIEIGDWQVLENPEMKFRARTFLFKLQNKYFRLGGALGVFHRGFVKLNYLRSEVNLLSIGPAWILTIPGEINPEIVNGGVENPDGADFPGEPVESPPIRKLMQGKYNFVIGMGNDEVGYIMPKTHWDAKPPYTYSSKKGFYGEVNSLGPDAGPKMYEEVKKIIKGF
jgi:hypothetical protein